MKQSEKKEAKRIFGGKAGSKLLKEMGNTFTPGEDLEHNINAMYAINLITHRVNNLCVESRAVSRKKKRLK